MYACGLLVSSKTSVPFVGNSYNIFNKKKPLSVGVFFSFSPPLRPPPSKHFLPCQSWTEKAFLLLLLTNANFVSISFNFPPKYFFSIYMYFIYSLASIQYGPPKLSVVASPHLLHILILNSGFSFSMLLINHGHGH